MANKLSLSKLVRELRSQRERDRKAFQKMRNQDRKDFQKFKKDLKRDLLRTFKRK